MRKFVSFHLPALLWAVLIFVLSSIPQLTPPPVGFQISDKIYHFLEFGVFGWLLVRSLTRLYPHRRRGTGVLLAALLGILWGGLDEVHQAFVPGRDASVLDGLADAAGVLIVSAALWWRMRRRDTKTSE
jgi:VanZ family protein